MILQNNFIPWSAKTREEAILSNCSGIQAFEAHLEEPASASLISHEYQPAITVGLILS